MDESSSNSNIIFEPKNSPEVKRITVTRHVTTHITEEPQIVIENARSSSTMTTERHLLHKKPPKRVYPIVTVKVSDLPPTFMKPEQVYEPPKDYLFDPIEIPIERTYRLNSIRTSSAKPCETVPEPHPRRMKGDLPQCDPEAMNGNDGGGYKQLDNWHKFEILKKKLSTDSYDNQRHVTPDEIAEECRRMLNELQDDEEKENRIVYGRSHGQVDEEIDKLKKQVKLEILEENK
ncbi:unnamed protein product [Auanema sp. JU1783]|nr:unnamed protein product [Auanema sp. JU1783]